MRIRGIALRVGPCQATGLVGVALFAVGAALAVVLPQLTPPIYSSPVLTWGLTAVGALLFWIGVIGGIAEALRGTGRRPDLSRPESPRPR